MRAVYVVGTLDTKREELAYVRDVVEATGWSRCSSMLEPPIISRVLTSRPARLPVITLTARAPSLRRIAERLSARWRWRSRRTSAPTSHRSVDEFFARARELATIGGVNDFEVLRQVGRKNDFTHSLSMYFDDQSAYDSYNSHPDHRAFVNDVWLPNVADFLELDYVRDEPRAQQTSRSSESRPDG